MPWRIYFAELSIVGTFYVLLLMNSVVRYSVGQEHENKLGNYR